MRQAQLRRQTKETEIDIELCLDGSGKYDIETGIGFFDHMLSTLVVHASFDLKIRCSGDLKVDAHHTVEDAGILLGKALLAAAGDRKGIERFGDALIPMDEALALASVDICGRSYLCYEAEYCGHMIGAMDTQTIEEFWRAFALNAQLTIHLRAMSGQNDHHKAEAIFKAAAHALRKALVIKGDTLLSVKGSFQ
jgi:imidazoleglycerol-phosphate dehydratase